MKKEEILTIEDLKKVITNSPVKPKANCQSLYFIFGWRDFIKEYLTDTPLSNHSKCNAFLISYEKGCVKLRGKKLPQHSDYFPRAGIRLLKMVPSITIVSNAEFRIEKLNFNQILIGLNIHLRKLSRDKKNQVEQSWLNLKNSLESLPGRDLPKMDLSLLPKQKVKNVTVPDHLVQVDHQIELRGDIYEEEASDGCIEDEVAIGMDVCIYTAETHGRPWVGRVMKVKKEEKRFIIQWYTRKTARSLVFTALVNNDGSPNLSEISNSSVMFWMMSEPSSRTDNSFRLTPPWLQTIEKEYESLDQNF